MCINKNLVYGMCIYFSYIKLRLSVGENVNYLCFNVILIVFVVF